MFLSFIIQIESFTVLVLPIVWFHREEFVHRFFLHILMVLHGHHNNAKAYTSNWNMSSTIHLTTYIDEIDVDY